MVKSAVLPKTTNLCTSITVITLCSRYTDGLLSLRGGMVKNQETRAQQVEVRLVENSGWRQQRGGTIVELAARVEGAQPSQNEMSNTC